MHGSSYKLMEQFVEKYLPNASNVLDIGGNYNSDSYMNLVNKHGASYKTLDWKGGDYTVNGYDWSNVPKENFDVVLSGQAFEHDLFFWKTLENIRNVLKEKG